MSYLSRLFVVIAVIEAFYGLAGLLIPAGLIEPVLGWKLSADGHWITKLLGAALFAQALTAWVLRHDPPPPIARVLAVYQLLAVAVDAGSWFLLADRGVFSTDLARASVLFSIALHFTLGVALLVLASRAETAHTAEVRRG